MTTCHYDRDLGHRVIPNRHHDLCDGGMGDCGGCQPCEHRHCCLPGCWKHTDDQHPNTCPECVGNVREDLAEILRLHDHLPPQAVDGGNDGRLLAGAPIPGGEATVMHGPAANYEAWSYRTLSALMGRCNADHLEDQPDTDPHPLLTLARHEDIWRDWLNQPTRDKATVWTAVDYLGEQLTMMAQVIGRTSDDGQVEFAPDFGEFAADLAQLRARLEDVLVDGERDDETKTPCLDCGTRLVRRYGRRATDDHHQCPRCNRTYRGDEFARAKHHHLASEDASTWVPLSHAAQIVDRSGRTLRTWVRELEVTAYCDRLTHRLYVWWPDVRARNQEATRRRLRRRVA